jgi:radical SAM/Cys-rich protein
MNLFDEKIESSTGAALRAVSIDVMQVNLGLLCNQECLHCHLSASPRRTESMDWDTMFLVLAAADTARPGLVDLTGGAPELNPHFREFVDALTADGHAVQVRTNLTAMLTPGLEDLARFLADRKVGLAGSMPCYLEENVRAQRGPGVYEKSVAAIRRLNLLGYGVDPALRLDLVYNPGGASLPPGQAALEADYRRELASRAGVSFTNLLSITNMPLGRFGGRIGEDVKRGYMGLLEGSFNPDTVSGLMCTRQVSVRWDGALFDCDFNIALGLPVEPGAPGHISAFDKAALIGRRIVTGPHCFGCTAGHGSSCMGALV